MVSCLPASQILAIIAVATVPVSQGFVFPSVARFPKHKSLVIYVSPHLYHWCLKIVCSQGYMFPQGYVLGLAVLFQKVVRVTVSIVVSYLLVVSS